MFPSAIFVVNRNFDVRECSNVRGEGLRPSFASVDRFGEAGKASNHIRTDQLSRITRAAPCQGSQKAVHRRLTVSTCRGRRPRVQKIVRKPSPPRCGPQPGSKLHPSCTSQTVVWITPRSAADTFSSHAHSDRRCDKPRQGRAELRRTSRLRQQLEMGGERYLVVLGVNPRNAAGRDFEKIAERQPQRPPRRRNLAGSSTATAAPLHSDPRHRLSGLFQARCWVFGRNFGGLESDCRR